MKKTFILLMALLAQIGGTAVAQSTEQRALWASINGTKNASLGDYQQYTGKVLVSWRMLPGDDENTAFDLYRKNGNTERKVNSTPIVGKTNLQDASALGTSDNVYRLTYAGSNETLATYTLPATQVKSQLPYISIPLKGTTDVCSIDTICYQANDCSVGDLDGDGEYEIVVKRLLTVKNAKGEILSDGTGGSTSHKDVRHTVLWDAYKLNGTLLWRICSGPNIILGNSSAFAIADYDGDGCAEMIIKTSEGTIFGDGYEIPDTDNDGKTDYRTNYGGWIDNYSSEGPEFFSVIDGKTGKELARENFIARGKSEDWGDNYFKRACSFRVGVACFDGELPSVVFGRGVYARSVLEAWDWREGQLTRRWHFDSNQHAGYASQGYHSLSTGDVDGDGFDEVVYGSMTVDHDGQPYHTTKLGHGDALHLGKFIPSREGLQIYACYETGKTMTALRDAKTDEILWSNAGSSDNDMGRCCIGDIDPSSPGCEIWWYGSNAHSYDGKDLGFKPKACNMMIWFDGTLTRQHINENIIQSDKNGRTFTMYRYDESFNNGTKSNPGWYGDILGDWREEVIVPDGTKLKDIKIFSTWYPSSHKFPWLMTDHIYEMSALNQNIGYNQPTHTGYYLGTDLKSDTEAWAAGGYTSIEEIRGDIFKEQGDGRIYDLQGRPVSQPARGIYIRNGKKIFVQ